MNWLKQHLLIATVLIKNKISIKLNDATVTFKICLFSLLKQSINCATADKYRLICPPFPMSSTAITQVMNWYSYHMLTSFQY